MVWSTVLKISLELLETKNYLMNWQKCSQHTPNGVYKEKKRHKLHSYVGHIRKCHLSYISAYERHWSSIKVVYQSHILIVFHLQFKFSSRVGFFIQSIHYFVWTFRLQYPLGVLRHILLCLKRSLFFPWRMYHINS